MIAWAGLMRPTTSAKSAWRLNQTSLGSKNTQFLSCARLGLPPEVSGYLYIKNSNSVLYHLRNLWLTGVSVNVTDEVVHAGILVLVKRPKRKAGSKAKITLSLAARLAKLPVRMNA